QKTGVLIQDFPRVLREHASESIQSGELFGEIGALGRTQRVATIVASEDNTEVLELRWQGLRDIMNFAPAFNAYIEDRFRKYGLISLLRALDIMARLPTRAAEEVAMHTVFERYGRFDWYGSYQQMLRSASASERLDKEPLILREGDYLNGLIIVRGGFVRVSRHYNHGEQTTSYLGKGQYFGLGEIYHNHLHSDRPVPAQSSLRGVGYVDILVIPTALVEEHIIPHLTPAEIRELALPLPSGLAAGEHSEPAVARATAGADTRGMLGADMIEFFMDRRVINGGATMLIDLDRCTRCDDCVRACASTHDGNPRFIRQGPNQQGIQVTQACMHCHDPICMIPCPTGAIHRREGGEVVINDDTCIGCASCAENCPYHNIQMVEVRSPDGELQFPVSLDTNGNIVFGKDGRMIPRTDEGAVRRATKCDLCYDHVGGPACARACPHDALLRIDMQDTRAVAEWLSR
ncbi:MAG TPA: cyclic nucleotide-binding domain-containing protein, partial [Burkholderiales bacterium]|nr:cyclic nucleotide-binding domain-containing protein [Burkholderiales bacterium]